MARTVKFIALMAAATLLFSGLVFGQVTSLAGTVIGEDGKPVKDAVIQIERQDIKGHYQTKTNKKGEYFHAGLPIGTYTVKCEIGGKVVDQVNAVRTHMGDPTQVQFNLAEVRKRQQEQSAGTLTDEQKRGLSEEQRKQLEEEMAKRAEAMKKNKELNDSFNAGMDAMKAGNLEAAADAFTKAAAIDPKQFAVWAQLADTYSQLAGKQTGDEKNATIQKAIDSYTKALELKPEDDAAHNNFGLLYAKAGKIDLAEEELKKAATLNPAEASKYYYNLGAVLTNTGQTDAALDAFKQAIVADPNNADAQYQLGVTLLGKATTMPDGSIKPPEGTQEAFQKYLDLQPNGPYAEAAKQMIETIGGKVETKYANPDAKKAAPKGRK
jgi:tetratricopeptide (TPR) repeat protein